MTAQLSDVSGRTFDYVVVGGGTAGLVVATRLSSDPSVTVAVLEAGESHIGDPNVTTSATNSLGMGHPKYDWGFKSVPQRNGAKAMFPRGKGLGGTSAINWQFWITPHKDDIDAFEKLGNPGWNWSDYVKYFKRVETFHPASEMQRKDYSYTHNSVDHGVSGPIQTRFPRHSITMDTIFTKSIEKIGIKMNPNVYGGDNNGTRIIHSNVEPGTWHRSYSASAYYLPVRDRKNLVVLTEALVSRVLFGDSTAPNGDIIATGVEFIHDGKKHSVKCAREVIVSAGTIKSPQVLELSGIGRADVLKKIGVDIKVELPGVGENVQEHSAVLMSWKLDPDKAREVPFVLLDPSNLNRAVKEPIVSDEMPNIAMAAFSYFPVHSVFPESAANIIKSGEEEVDKLKRSGTLPPGLAEQYDLQLNILRDPTVPDCQIFNIPGPIFVDPKHTPEESFMSVVLLHNHTFSRGTIHARSADPNEHPDIDPRYNEVDIDRKILMHHFAVSRKMTEQEPAKSTILQEIIPGPEVKTEEDIKGYVDLATRSAYHTAGSCSMLPLKNQGVVSPELIVYGTKNLRVVDLSIVPLQFAAHPQATVYVIAEKAADIIRGV